MIVQYLPFITVAVMVFFLIITLLFKKDKNKLYVQFVLIAYPLIGLNLITQTLPINNFEAITVLFMFAFYKPTSLHHKRTNTNAYLILLGILWMAGLSSAFMATSITEDTIKAFIELSTLCTYVFVLIKECTSEPAFVYKVLQSLRISIVVSLIFLALQLTIGLDFTISKSLNGNVFQDDAIRYPSYFQDPQKYAQFLSITSFLMLVNPKDSLKIPIGQYFLLAVMIVAMLLTGGRAALGGWLIGFLFVLLCSNIDFKIMVGVLMLIGSIFIYQYKEQFIVFNRGDNLNDSYVFRMGIWKEAYQIFKAHPLLGIAPGNYAHYVSIHYPDQFWMLDNEIVYYDHPESGYLKILTEYGLIGFLAIFILVLLPMIKGVIRFFQTKDTLFIFLVAAMISWLIGFYTIYSLGDVRIQILIGTIIGVLIARNTKNIQFNSKNVPIS